MKKLKYILISRRQYFLQVSNPLGKQSSFQQYSYCYTSVLTASIPAGQSLDHHIIYLLALTPNE